MLSDDTIAAIATPAGPGSIGVIRISGSDSLKIASALTNKSNFPPRTSVYSQLFDPGSGDVLDDTVVVYFPGPASYTGQDTVEISCHGSVAVLRGVLTAVLRLGARLAEPGEFTKRAYINGKLDLSQAEAVNDLIKARTDSSRRSALAQLHRALSRKLEDIDQMLLGLLAAIEASIDFPEDVDEPDDVATIVEACIDRLAELDRSYRSGRVLREGARVTICGSVNAGKSSVLNALLKRERAIVTPIPGTTRDLIEEGLEIRGIPITAIDTAGIRQTDDPVEALGLRMAVDSISNADIVLLIMDGSRPPVEEDIRAVENIEGSRCILVVNKMDRASNQHVEQCVQLVNTRFADPVPLVRLSAMLESGFDELEQAIYEKLATGAAAESAIITNIRHHEAVLAALESLDRVRSGLQQLHPLDLLCIDISEARRHLGLITGRTVGEDVLDSIFSQFCIGK